MGFPLASPAERMSSHRENGTVAGGKRRGRPVSALKRRASYILRHGLHQLQCAVGSGFRQFACVLLCVALQTAQAGVHQAVGILRLTSRPPLFSPGLPFNPHFRGRGGSRRRWGRLVSWFELLGSISFSALGLISVVEISMNNSSWNIRSVMDEALVDGSTFVPLLIAMIVRFTAQPAG